MDLSHVRRLGRMLCGGMLLLLAGPLNALEPPTPEQVRQYKADGTWPQRLAWAKALGNDQADPVLVSRMQARLASQAAKAAGLPVPQEAAESPGGSSGDQPRGLPPTGTQKVLVILVDFPDQPHGPNDTVADVQNKFFGDGDASQHPYESLRNFYQRSSYGQLTIQGNVLGWYRAQHDRSYYQAAGSGQELVIMEALNYFNAQGHDFTQYDANNDGVIDGLFVKWTGPDTGWSSFWWAYSTGWYANPTYRVDGKKPGGYIWSWIWNQAYDGQTIYQAHVDIHETGHMIGLPDYYDYDGNVGPDGGVGGLDMMDANWGDHNCFSKFVLGWLTPTFVVGGSQTLALNPSGTSKDCVLIMPQSMYTPGTSHAEFFMAQYRKRGAGNDPTNYPADGYTIWHVDSSGSYNNSYTDHKLLRLMEADGLEQIEQNQGVNAGDFYISGKAFGDATTPNSKAYSGASTNVLVNQFTAPEITMGACFTIQSGPLMGNAGSNLVEEMCQPADQAIDPGETVTVNFSLQNVGTVNTTNLIATLLPTGGVTAPSAAQNYGATTPLGPVVTRSFSFVADGTCGGTLTATLQLQDGATSFPSAVFTFPLGAPDGAGGYTCCWTPNLLGDFDGDNDVDQEDFGRFQVCLTAGGVTAPESCQPGRMDLDVDVDQSDMALFKKCHTQPGVPVNPDCRSQ